MLIAFNKPSGVLSQFTSDGSPNRALAEFGFPKNVYPIGRLDADSEGLLLLSDEPELNDRLLHPRHSHEREYWAQVERIPMAEALRNLSRGVTIQGRKTLPCRAWLLDPQPEIFSLSPSAGERAGERGSREQNIPPLPSPLLLPREEREKTRDVPQFAPRDPPIRFRKSVPDCWIGLELVEGKNRQVRRMTAAIGHPTLRLLRVRIGGLRLEDLPPGKWKELSREERQAVLQ